MYKVNYNKDCYAIVEEKTGLEIKSFPHDKYPTPKEAKAFCHRLNGGGGFAGNTPEFFMHRLEVTEHAD